MCVCSAELELRSLSQRLDESTAISQALRLELQLSQRLLAAARSSSADDDKENSHGMYQHPHPLDTFPLYTSIFTRAIHTCESPASSPTQYLPCIFRHSYPRDRYLVCMSILTHVVHTLYVSASSAV